MELEDLAGLHTLSGVDMNYEEIPGQFQDSQVVSFVLDGITYTAIENPDDGYRSMMGEIKQSNTIVKNSFQPVTVMAVMRVDHRARYGCDILDFYDVKTAEIVLSIGTDDWEDYYPVFVAEFTPENMIINKGVGNG